MIVDPVLGVASGLTVVVVDPVPTGETAVSSVGTNSFAP